MRVARDEEAQLPVGMVGILDEPCQGVGKGSGGLFETDAVPSEIRFRFALVPRKKEVPEAIPLHKTPHGLVASATTAMPCTLDRPASALSCGKSAWRERVA